MTGFDGGFFDRLKGALSCDCPACVRHGEVHEQVPRVIFGATVQIDRELAPLLDSLCASGVLTVASCVDLAEAIARFAPENLAALVAVRDAPGVHVGRVAADRLMFVRLLEGQQATPFLDAAERCGGIVTRMKPLAQVAFPRELLPELVEAARS